MTAEKEVTPRKVTISNPPKPWWQGDARVEPYMTEVRSTILGHVTSERAVAEIYNRCYEAVYRAIQDYDKAAKP